MPHARAGGIERTGKDLIAATRPYQAEQRWRSWLHLLGTTFLLVIAMVAAAVATPIAVRAMATIFAALLMLKMFIVYHDFMHRALLRRSRLAKVLMHGFGYFILAPPAIWKRSHDYHHAHTAKLAGSHMGSFPTLSTLMYERLTPSHQRSYRIARSPLVIMFGLLTVFLFGMCISPLAHKPRDNRDAAYALLLYAAIGVIVVHFFGLAAYVLAVLLPHGVAAAIGAYLFYAQHNFPGVEFRSRQDWQYTHAALWSSSYCRMGPVMRWFSGNIGFHHVHHLNASIPFYNLPEAMAGVPELGRPVATSLHPREIARCLALKLWEPAEQRMVSFPRASISERWSHNLVGLKPSAVEEPIDIYWHRPLAGMLARVLARTSISPNQVTLVSGTLGLLSGVALSLSIVHDPLFATLGGVLLGLSAIVDCADGQLARMKHLSSTVGRALDGLVDSVAPTAALVAMVAVLIARGNSAPMVLLAAIATAASLVWHANQYDVAKNVYLHCAETAAPAAEKTLLSTEDISRLRSDLRAQGKPLSALLIRVWRAWTRAQMAQISPWLGTARSPKDDEERELYRSCMQPSMRVATWMGFGLHVSILGASMLALPWLPPAIWIGWSIIVGPLNMVAIHHVLARRTAERRYLSQLTILREARGAAPAS